MKFKKFWLKVLHFIDWVLIHFNPFILLLNLVVERGTRRRKLANMANPEFKKFLLSTFIPSLEKFGFQLFLKKHCGWDRSNRCYEYFLGRLKGNKLEVFDISSHADGGTICVMAMNFKLTGLQLDNLSNFPLWSLLFLNKYKKTAKVKYYTLKKYKSEKQLIEKSLPRLKQEIEKDFSSVEQVNKIYFEENPEVTVDLKEEIRLEEEWKREWDEEEAKQEEQRQLRKQRKEERERKKLEREERQRKKEEATQQSNSSNDD